MRIVNPGKKPGADLGNVKIPVSYWAIDPNSSANLINPSFDDGPSLPNLGGFQFIPQADVPGWDTTDGSGTIEIWSTGFQGTVAHEGDYFVEMNAREPGRLSQTITVSPNAGVLNWQVCHSARSNSGQAWSNPNDTNTAEVMIGLDGVDTTVQTMTSPTGGWTLYSGTMDKPCGVTQVEIAFNAIDPPNAGGNFIDDVRLDFFSFNTDCQLGSSDLNGTICDANGAPLAPGSYTLCDPTCPAAGQTLNVVTKDLYEYREIWAEESGGLTNGNIQYSFGNGATGGGIPFDENWEVISMAFQADAHAANSSVTVDLIDIKSGTPNVISSITLDDAADGGGQTNNSCKFEQVSAAIPGFSNLTFQTRTADAGIADVRVYARFRRRIGQCVESVSFV